MTSKPTDDLLQRCRELLELNEKGESQQTALRALAATYDRESAAHDRGEIAVSQTHLEAMRALLAATQQASTEIDELKSKLAFYEREREDQNRYLAAQSAEIAGLKQRLAQQPSGEVTDDKLDAERYRWLREQSNDPDVLPRIEVVRWEAIDESTNGGEGLRMEALDSVIDAARTQGGES